MNLLTPISLYYLIYRSAAARVYSVQCGFIYFTCVSHKKKKQDCRNKTEDVISLSVAHLHICAIKAQKAPEIIRHVDEVHPCPQRARHFLSRIWIWQMILKFYFVFSFKRFRMLFASRKALQTNLLRIPVPTLCNIQKVHKVTGKRKLELGRRTMTRASKRKKDFRAEWLAKTKAVWGSGEAAETQGVRWEGSERKCQILLTPSACCLLVETVERQSVLKWINYYSLLTYTCSHLGLEIAFVYLQHAQGHHVFALRPSVSSLLVPPTVIQSHHLYACLKLKNIVTS